MNSPSFNAVVSAAHPSPECGGPCATCAFRAGTEANRSEHTVALAKACVEGLRYFYCHEGRKGLCRGFIAAINLRGVPASPDDERHCDAAGHVADFLGDAITAAVNFQNAAAARTGERDA